MLWIYICTGLGDSASPGPRASSGGSAAANSREARAFDREASDRRVGGKVLQGQEVAVLVDVPRDCDVAAGAVALDADPAFLPAGAWAFSGEAPDMQSVATGRDLNVVAWVGRDERGCFWHEFAFADDVIEVDAADTVAEHEAGADAVARG